MKWEKTLLCFRFCNTPHFLRTVPGRIRGGGGGRGSGPPFLAHVVGFLTWGLKLDPLLDPPCFACRPIMAPPPLLKNPGSAPAVLRTCDRQKCVLWLEKIVYAKTKDTIGHWKILIWCYHDSWWSNYVVLCEVNPSVIWWSRGKISLNLEFQRFLEFSRMVLKRSLNRGSQGDV